MKDYKGVHQFSFFFEVPLEPPSTGQMNGYQGVPQFSIFCGFPVNLSLVLYTFITEKTLTNCSFNMADISISSLPASTWLTLDIVGIADCKQIHQPCHEVTGEIGNE